MFATPRVASDHGDELGKDDLLDALIVVKVKEYNPDTETKYGRTATLIAHVTVVDGAHAGEVEPRFYAAGNLARQIGDALDEGAMAPGRIRKGDSANGRQWYGIEWCSDPEDLAAAEAAMRPPVAPAAPRQTIAEQLKADKARLAAQPRATFADDTPPF